MTTKPQKKRQNWILGLFFIIIVGPMLFAWVLVKKNDLVHFKLNHHGDLLATLPNIKSLPEIDYQPHQGKWLMLIVGPQTCQQTHGTWLYDLQQLKKAMGKDASRVSQAFVTLSNADSQLCGQLLSEYPDLTPMSMPEDSFLRELGDYSHAIKRELQGELFIVDPQGNIMMHYDATVPTRDILSDMKRLLRVSKIG